MRILVCGSRDWTDKNAIESALKAAFGDTIGNTIINGAAKGADTIAVEIGRTLVKTVGLILHYPADWEKYGKAAGPIRNQQMLDEGKPDLVLAFWNGISRGTLDMVTRAKAAGVKVRVIRE